MIRVRLSELLEQRGKTLYWLSQETGIRWATIWQLGQGEVARLNMDVLDRVCEALECQPGDVLIREASRKGKPSRRKASKRVRGDLWQDK